MAVTAPEGVSAVWLCGGRAGAGQDRGSLFGHTARPPPSCEDSPPGNGGHSVCFHSASWERRSKTTFGGI